MNLSIGSPDTILNKINLAITSGSLVAITGPTGSGKSLLARSIVGEVPCAPGSRVQLSTRHVAYCSQTAWLPDCSLKEAITQVSRTSGDAEDRYQQVLQLCCLEDDIAVLPAGDGTSVGPRGMSLSGGQRQRVVSLGPVLGAAMFRSHTRSEINRSFCDRHLLALYTRRPRPWFWMTLSARWTARRQIMSRRTSSAPVEFSDSSGRLWWSSAMQVGHLRNTEKASGYPSYD